MPWSPKQMKAIRAKKHGWNPKGDDEPFAKVGKKKLGEMEEEGVKPAKKGGFPFKKKGKKKGSLKAQMEALRG